jgi:methyl-accepting chemotaxis protein
MSAPPANATELDTERELMKLSLQTKLLGAFGIVLALTALLGILSINTLAGVNSKGGAMYTGSVVPLREVSEARALLGDIDSQIQRAITDIHGSDATYARISDADVKQIDAAIAKHRGAFSAPAELTALRSFDRDWAAYRLAYSSVLRSAARGDEAAATKTYFAKGAPIYAAVDRALARLSTLGDQTAKQIDREISSAYDDGRTLIIALIALAIASGSGIAFVISRSISRSSKQILAAAEKIAVGDVEQTIDVKTSDEFAAIAEVMRRVTDYLREMVANTERIAEGDLTVRIDPKSPRDALGIACSTMVESMRQLVSSMSTTASTLSASSQQMVATSDETGRAIGEIASAVVEVAQGAERQVAGVEAARRATAEVTLAVGQSAEHAQETAHAAVEAREIARQGVKTARSATDAMQAVRDSSQSVSTVIGELDSKSGQIGGIVATISGIAEQTNLLALNAAIEAARAGEQGRGFAVVAEEVRMLAEESAKAADLIAGLIEQIQTETKKAVRVVEDGTKRTEDGAVTAAETRDAFERIGLSVDGMGERIGQIAGATQQIAASASQMEREVDEVAKMAELFSASAEQVSASTEQTSASTQQIAASAQDLAGTAEELARLVGAFTVD